MISPVVDTLIWTVAFAAAFVLSLITFMRSWTTERVAKEKGTEAQEILARGIRRANTLRTLISALGLIVGIIALINIQWYGWLPARLTSLVFVTCLLGIAVLIAFYAFTDLYTEVMVERELREQENEEEAL